MRWKSEITTGPHSPAVRLFWLSSTGCPVEVVITWVILWIDVILIDYGIIYFDEWMVK